MRSVVTAIIILSLLLMVTYTASINSDLTSETRNTAANTHTSTNPSEKQDKATKKRSAEFPFKFLESHRIQEMEERELLEEGEGEERLGSDQHVRENMTEKLPLPGVKKSSTLKPLYELYALASYITSISEEISPLRVSKRSIDDGSPHISSLHSLYSLAGYVRENAEEDGSDSQSSSLKGNESETETMDKGFSSQWTYHVVIALSVMAAVVVMLVTGVCVMQYCRRNEIYNITTSPVVRGGVVPSTQQK